MDEAQVTKLVEIVAGRLEGQCVVSLEQALEEAVVELGLPADATTNKRVLEDIESKVFLCDGCGWYCSTDELHNMTMDDLCDDCTEEDEDDD